MLLNLQEETRDGYTISAEMKKVWQVEIDIMLKILEVCKKHNLRCWLDSGTLLGAVRHKGFIPWDDDIDLTMPRADYDKLCAIADKEFQHPYFFQTTFTDTGYITGHAQVRNSLTTTLGEGDERRPFNCGIPVDIFVLDAVPETKVMQFLQRTATMILKKTIRASFTPVSEQKKTGKKILSFFSKGLYSVLPYRTAFRWFESLFRCVSTEKTSRIAPLSFRYTLRSFVFQKEYFSDTVYLEFEGMQVPVPANYHEVLVHSYGPDYMTPVKAPSMHGVRMYDTEKSYLEYRKSVNCKSVNP